MSTVTGAVPPCRTTRSVPAAPEMSTTTSTGCGPTGSPRGSVGEERPGRAAPPGCCPSLVAPASAYSSPRNSLGRTDQFQDLPATGRDAVVRSAPDQVVRARQSLRKTTNDAKLRSVRNSGTRSNKDLADRDIDHANVDTGPSERRMQLVPLSSGGRVTAVATASLPPGPLRVALRVSGEAVVIEALGPLGPTPVGRLSAADSAAYRPVLVRLAARGRTGTCPALAARTGDAATLTLQSRPARHLRAARSALRDAGWPSAADPGRPRADGPARGDRSGGPLSCAAPTPPRHRPAPACGGPNDQAEERGAAPAAVRTAPPIPAAGAPTHPVRATRRPRTPAHPQPAAPGALGDRGPRRRAAAGVADTEQHRHLGPPRRGDGSGHLPPRRHRELSGRTALRSPVLRSDDVR